MNLNKTYVSELHQVVDNFDKKIQKIEKAQQTWIEKLLKKSIKSESRIEKV